MEQHERGYLSVGAVAERLGLSASGVRKLEAQGVIPPSLRLEGTDRRRIWPAGDVDLMQVRIAERRAARTKETAASAA
jgi:DNA-binding transcriptional MerR regulator